MGVEAVFTPHDHMATTNVNVKKSSSNEPEQAHLLKMQTETITAVETVPSETSVLPTLLQTELSGSSSNLQGRVQLVNMQSEPLTSMEKVLKEANSSPNHLQTESSGSSVEGTSSQSSSSVTPPSKEQPDTSKTTTFTQHSFKKKRFVYGEIDFERNKCAKFIKVNDARSNLLKKLAQAVLKECPKLQDKNLLLSITDDARSLDDTHSGTFKESLKKILPGTCLVTGGTTTGVTQLVGECVREFNDSVRLTDGECKAIGIVNWDRCTHRHIIKDKGVLGIDVDGSVFVVDFGGKRWTFNPAFLPQYSITTYKNVQTRRAKTNIVTDGSRPFKDGDIVKICSDLKTLKKLQGELWNDGMMQTLGKIGTVVSVEPNLDLNIRVCGAELPYLPHAVALLTPETLTCQLNIEIHDHKPMKNELVRDVLKDDKQNVHDKLCTAIENQKPIRVGIDYNGDIFVKDPMGNRMTITLDKRTDVIASSTYYLHDTPNTTVAESSSDQSFAVGNLVQICNNSRTYNETQDHEWRINFDRTYGKIGTVLEVLGVDANSLMINVCGVKDLYQSQDVALVSVECITSQLKNWFETHKPRDENDEMVQAVLKDNVSEVRKLLGRDKKDIGIFGIDDDGFYLSWISPEKGIRYHTMKTCL